MENLKIKFKELKSSSSTIEVLFKEGEKWHVYNVDDARANGVDIPSDVQDLSSIKIKGNSKVLDSIDVVKSIEIDYSKASPYETLPIYVYWRSTNCPSSGCFLNVDYKRMDFNSVGYLYIKNTNNDMSYITDCQFTNSIDINDCPDWQGKEVYVYVNGEYKLTNFVLDFTPPTDGEPTATETPMENN